MNRKHRPFTEFLQEQGSTHEDLGQALANLVDRERTQFDEALGVVMEQWPVWVGSPGSVRSV